MNIMMINSRIAVSGPAVPVFTIVFTIVFPIVPVKYRIVLPIPVQDP